ncbi:MAG: hypothetical protein KHY89_06545 [Butyricicoccus pullicaecorum]|nr:hypothetical protein [Butyricicoccus pullicaecorum]
MSISMIGSINTYIKTLKMHQTWTERQQKGDYSGKAQSLDEWIQERTHEKGGINYVEPPQAPPDLDLQAIQTKVSNGKKLTPAEKDYLQKHDPETLEKAREIERTQENFKQALRRCRTKEDVERLRMTQLSSSMTTLNAVQNNPNIPLSKKLEVALQEQGKVNAAAREIRQYVKEGHYEKLPTDAEKIQAEQQEMEQNQPLEKPVQTEKPASPSESYENPPSVQTNTPETPEPPKIDVETPEQRKVKRAKAKAAYGQTTTMAENQMPVIDFGTTQLDIRG